MDALGVDLGLDIKSHVSFFVPCVFDEVIEGCPDLEQTVTLGKMADGRKSLGTVGKGTLHGKRTEIKARRRETQKSLE